MTGSARSGALAFHGDSEIAAGLVDLAVNVRTAPAPDWLAAPIAASLADLARYPDPGPARAALAARHGRKPIEVLPTAGAAQAFTLIAHHYAARPGRRRAIVVHPQFTEPEAALRAAGVAPDALILTESNGFRLDADAVPADADLVMIGNPTNPTSVLHPAAEIARLARPERLLVVDEAFADTVPGEPESLSARRDLPGLVVVRSLTKTWGLAGLRIGYALAAPDLIDALAVHQPLWPVSTPALAAAIACASPTAVAAEATIARGLAIDRAHLLDRLAAIEGVTVCGSPAASFILLRIHADPDARPETGPDVRPGGADVRPGTADVRPGTADVRLGGGADVRPGSADARPGTGAEARRGRGSEVRMRLRAAGFAVRRGDTFPGLGPDYIRVAVRDPAVSDMFARALAGIVAVDAAGIAAGDPACLLAEADDRDRALTETRAGNRYEPEV